MKIVIHSTIGKTSKRKAVIKAYNSNPGNFDCAVHAAAHYAKRNGERMVVISSNSYMQKVYRIARETDSLSRFNPGSKEQVVGVVTVDGEVFKAIASE